jgi:tetratricopeptide (TPR) repeat protein
VALLAQLSRAFFFAGDQRQAITLADRALETGERLDLAPVVSDVLITRGSALCHLGRSYEGLGAIRAGIELADERGLVSTALRGRLNVGVMAYDPRTSFETADAALAVARRFGLRGFVRTLVGNLAGAALDVGEWERAIRELTAAGHDSSDEFERNYLRWNLFTFSAWRGDDVAAEADELSSWAESMGESGAREAVHDLRAQVAFAAGNLPLACDEWMAFAPSDPLNAPGTYAMAGLAGILANDPRRAAAAVAALEALPGRGPLRALDLRLLRAGLAALEGRVPEAIREARAVSTEYGRLGLPWRQALAILMLAGTVGPDHAEVRAAAGSAREIFARLGARPFLERLEAALRPSVDRPVRAVQQTEAQSPALS